MLIKVLKKNKNRVNFAQINDLVKKEDPSFSVKNYGCSRIKTLIEKASWPEIGFEPEKKPDWLILKEVK